MLGLKLNHVSKRGHMCQNDSCIKVRYTISGEWKNPKFPSQLTSMANIKCALYKSYRRPHLSNNILIASPWACKHNIRRCCGDRWQPPLPNKPYCCPPLWDTDKNTNPVTTRMFNSGGGIIYGEITLAVLISWQEAFEEWMSIFARSSLAPCHLMVW